MHTLRSPRLSLCFFHARLGGFAVPSQVRFSVAMCWLFSRFQILKSEIDMHAESDAIVGESTGGFEMAAVDCPRDNEEHSRQRPGRSEAAMHNRVIVSLGFGCGQERSSSSTMQRNYCRSSVCSPVNTVPNHLARALWHREECTAYPETQGKHDLLPASENTSTTTLYPPKI